MLKMQVLKHDQKCFRMLFIYLQKTCVSCYNNFLSLFLMRAMFESWNISTEIKPLLHDIAIIFIVHMPMGVSNV